MTWQRLLLLAMLMAVPRAALAQARLVVLAPQEQAPRPSLVEALRLHLRGTAQVEVSTQAFPNGAAASRVALATRLVQAEQASFAIWLESAALGDGSTLFALYVVGGMPGRAVVEVVRLPAEADGPDVDRTLALKASEIIEAALAPSAILAAPPLRDAPAPPPLPPPPEPATSPPWLGLELSGALRNVTSVTEAEVGLGLGTGACIRTHPLALDVRVATILLSDSVVNGERRRVRISETDFQLGAGLRSRGPVQLGARLDADLRLLRAQGFLAAESTGSAVTLVPSLAAGPELRLELGPRLSFAAHVSAEWMVIRQSFVVGGSDVADLGRLRGNAQLFLIFFAL
jgi:hypothetical protein